MSTVLRGDGSSVEDAPTRVVIDMTDDVDRMRYTCPNGHRSWSATNSHVWCRGCAEATMHNDDADPDHYSVVDQRIGEEIPWSAVEVVGRRI